MSASGPVPYSALTLGRVAAAGGVAVASTVYHVPVVHRLLSPWFNDTLPLSAVPTDVDPKVASQRARKWIPHPLVGALMVALNAVGMVLWTVVFGDRLARSVNMGEVGVRDVVLTGILALIWVGLLLRALVRPPVVPPWSALVIYLIFFTSSVLAFLDIPYARIVFGTQPSWATRAGIAIEATNGAVTLLLALIAGSLRFNSPLTLARAPPLGNDDTVTFWQWITFSWMTPLIMRWSKQVMNEEDLPRLSPTMQTREVFAHFNNFRKNKLLWQILRANYFDILMDGTFTVFSVIFNYLSPYLLKKILDGLTPPMSSKNITQAYIFALAALLCSVAKAVADLVHLWHSRRANVRIRSQLIASIYHKALLRKDTAGVVASKEKEESNDDVKGKGKADAKKAKKEQDNEKAETADTGKVVNLMSTDANMVAGVFAMVYWLYSTPIELTVASVFLYQLLGWSAFAGIIVLVVATPINSLLSKRAMRIQKELLKARDKRMTVMNELIGGISFIKFFAWTEKWKGRATEARSNELSKMIRAIINNMCFQLTWMLVPIFVTLCAFFCYIYIAKKQLTISVAFTALTLFNMLRTPLNAVPMFIMWVMQALVSVKRTASFFEEGEVPDWVSSLKRDDDGPIDKETRIGFKNATLKWNAGSAGEESSKNGAPPTINVTDADAPEDGTDIESMESAVFELSGITIDFPVGKLSVVSGPTGAGKTATLVGLLGEMDLVEGETYLPKHPSQLDKVTGLRNSCAYAAQTPWLQQQSIKENILFGEPLDDDRYESVVDACALRTDFDILEDGDQTEIGAKGVSLSGGQKARVALARAVYSYTQHVLLDDPLAAVDSHTAKHLVDKCLNGPLLKGRTVILVSHHLDLLVPTADYIVRILDGRVDCQGSPQDLRESGELNGVVAVEDATAADKEPVSPDEPEAEEAKDLVKKDVQKDGPARKLVKDEERAVRSVKAATYLLYFRAATWTTWMMFFAVLIIAQVVSLLERLWLKWWGEHYEAKLHSLFTLGTPAPVHHAIQVYSNIAHHMLYSSGSAGLNDTDGPPLFTIQRTPEFQLPSANDHPGYYLSGYAIIMIGSALLMVVTNAIGAWGSYRAAKRLHDRLLDSVVHGSIRFFNTTPVGRIINRFSKDIETIDMRLNSSSRTVITFTFTLIFTIGMIAYIIPQFLLPAAFITALYYYYTVLYLRTGRSLRRLEATTRSPIFSGFAELLDGIISVRAFSAERRMFSKLCDQIDLSNSAYYYYWMTNRWLLLRFDCLGAAAVFFTTLLSLSGAVGVGYAAVAITSAQSFVQACYWLSRFWGEMEMDFNSVERVEEYLNIPTEPPGVIEGHRPPAGWPSYKNPDSFISAQELEIKYAPELPTVFKGSFNIRAGEKIGLIGRTGSGKSTIAMMMLRFTDPTSGRLLIDGVDITSIGVDDLRSKITYIPQDAVLFSGTMRDNLDPFHEHTDLELLEALQRVKLITGQTPAGSRQGSVRNLTALAEIDPPPHGRLNQLIQEERAAAGGSRSGSSTPIGAQTPTSRVHITLNTEVSAGGANFSQGQRQLVAMARALLRRSNLIIMDEATASVDFATDEALQNAIRSEFKDSTLITIAHRLSSVIDYDRLLVLKDGSVAEFDTPMNLLRRDSIFKGMAQNSGKYKELYEAAERKEAASSSATSETASGAAEDDAKGDSHPPSYDA